MGDVLVRNLDDAVIASLKRRANENGRSMQAELNEILVRTASHVSISDAREAAAAIRQRFAE
jgi:plasmid stability protein